MDNLHTDRKSPVKGSPAYRWRYWALIGVRVLSMSVMLVSVVFLVLGRPPVSTVAAAAEGTGLLVMLVSGILLRRLIVHGQP